MKFNNRFTAPFFLRLILMFVAGFAAGGLTGSASAESSLFAPIPPLNSAMNAKYLNGIQASKSPAPKKLLPLNSNGKFPLSVIPQGSGSGLNADTLDGLDSSSFATLSSGKVALSAVPQGSGSGLDADTLDGQEIAAFVHTADINNSSGNSTKLDNPATNNNPSAIVMVTHVFYVGPGGSITNSIGVQYMSGYWYIVLEGAGSMTVGTTFNVMVITP